MPLAPAPRLPEIQIHAARPSSGLRRLCEISREKCPPYWAYPWAGGVALARHFFERPITVAGRRVLDFGAGSGIVGIAAAKCGAKKVIAAEIDRNAIEALRLNAAANGVSIDIVAHDIVDAEPPPVDLVAAGDVFYDPDLARKVTAFLDRCLARGLEVLVGDPGRAYLPSQRLRIVAEYPAVDFGDAPSGPARRSSVFAFEREIATAP
ncbi:MAG TPA: 50S ribosomal protein L11 methyltransferase [Roseiarcus sp.]|nr:50S ribosomal protein L11 methyltransferase [Roseiarcus sp.]